MGGFTLRIIYENGSLNWSFPATDFSLSDIEKWIDKVVIEGTTDYETCLRALAAIDKLARMKSKNDMKSACTNHVDSTVPNQTWQPSKELIKKSLKTLKGLVDESSMLSDIWGIHDKHGTWKSRVNVLESMLKK